MLVQVDYLVKKEEEKKKTRDRVRNETKLGGLDVVLTEQDRHFDYGDDPSPAW